MQQEKQLGAPPVLKALDSMPNEMRKVALGTNSAGMCFHSVINDRLCETADVIWHS
jgi:hypothetical protein